MGYAITIPLGGKISLPVSSSSYVYSHFKHVSGIPIPEEVEGMQGVTITRLKIIDVLMEQLNRIKKQEELANSPASEDYIDVLIKQFKNEVKQIHYGGTLPYSPRPEEPVGALFDLVS
jgi:hypothetical protein